MQKYYLKNIRLAGIVLSLFLLVNAGLTRADEPEPVLVKDIRPGGYGSDLTTAPYGLTNVNGTLFFNANGGSNRSGLWKSNGTEAGTVLVKDTPSDPFRLTNVNGTLFFTPITGPSSGTELWKSNGTEAGTVLVKDIKPGYYDSDPSFLTNLNGTLFFTASEGCTACLWKSNGTAAGTVQVKDSILIYHMINLNGVLFLYANDGSSHGLWKSNGTNAGTVLVKAGVEVGSLTNVNGTVFFRGSGGQGRELWKSNGTEVGTVLVKDINPSGSSFPLHLTNVNGTVFFEADDGVHSTELWKSNGTAAGTVLVKDINPLGGSSPSYLTNVNGTLFFYAYDGITGPGLWKSNGTAAGTVLVKSNVIIYDMININGTLYFGGDELWKSNGTTAGTVMVKDINPSGKSSPRDLTNINGTLFFTAIDGGINRELWKLSDGQVTPDTQIPTSPQLITPTLGVNLTTLRPVFDWINATDNVGVVSYTLTLKDAENRTSKFISTISTYTPRSNLAQSHYTWSVTAHDAAGNSSAPSHPANFAIISQAPLNKKAYLPIVLKK